MFRRRFNKTGVTHRFFCAGILCLLTVALTGQPLGAQIVLPDTQEEGADPGAPPEVMVTPVPEDDVREAIEQLQRSPNRQWMKDESVDGKDDLPEVHLLEAARTRYETAAARLRVRGEIHTGTFFQGELRNRSFFVDYAAGAFPVLWGELRYLQKSEAGETFVLAFLNGDRLEGRPRLKMLRLQLLEGGERMIRLRDIRRIEFLPLL